MLINIAHGSICRPDSGQVVSGIGLPDINKKTVVSPKHHCMTALSHNYRRLVFFRGKSIQSLADVEFRLRVTTIKIKDIQKKNHFMCSTIDRYSLTLKLAM